MDGYYREKLKLKITDLALIVNSVGVIIISIMWIKMWIVMMVFERFPHVYNYANITKKNNKTGIFGRSLWQKVL